MPLRLEQPAHQRLAIILVVDGERAREAEQLGLAPQQPRGEAVEGADPEAGRIAAEHAPDARLHFPGGLVGEGHREDALDRHPMLLDEVDDARREHPGLARAGAGEHEHGAVDVLHGLTLCGVQPFEPLHDELAS